MNRFYMVSTRDWVQFVLDQPMSIEPGTEFYYFDTVGKSSFEQIFEAHRYVDKGHKKGNVVITVAF